MNPNAHSSVRRSYSNGWVTHPKTSKRDARGTRYAAKQENLGTRVVETTVCGLLRFATNLQSDARHDDIKWEYLRDRANAHAKSGECSDPNGKAPYE